MQIMRRLNFKNYSQYLNNKGGNFINLIVIGNDNKIPFAFALNATLNEVSGTPVVKCTASIFKNKTTILHAGETDAVAKYINNNPQALQKELPVPLIDKLMKLVIKDKPLTVGLPIDIIDVRNTGIRWIRQKKGCPL